MRASWAMQRIGTSSTIALAGSTPSPGLGDSWAPSRRRTRTFSANSAQSRSAPATPCGRGITAVDGGVGAPRRSSKAERVAVPAPKSARPGNALSRSSAWASSWVAIRISDSSADTLAARAAAGPPSGICAGRPAPSLSNAPAASIGNPGCAGAIQSLSVRPAWAQGGPSTVQSNSANPAQRALSGIRGRGRGRADAALFGGGCIRGDGRGSKNASGRHQYGSSTAAVPKHNRRTTAAPHASARPAAPVCRLPPGAVPRRGPPACPRCGPAPRPCGHGIRRLRG